MPCKQTDYTDWCYIESNASCQVATNDNGVRIPFGTLGSAVVGAGEDVSVVVDQFKNSETDHANYTGVLPHRGSGDPSWEFVGGTFYAPQIKRNWYGRSSIIHIRNVRSGTVWPVVTFYDGNGVARSHGAITLAPNQKVMIDPSAGSGTTGGCATTSSVCSAVITGSAIAVVVEERNDADGLKLTLHNAATSSTTEQYFPMVKYQYYNETTGIRIQNTSSASNGVTVTYYRPDGTAVCNQTRTIAAYASATFFASCGGANFLGSAKATSSSIAGMANEETDSNGRLAKSSTGVAYGSYVLHVPNIVQGANGYTYDTGTVVRNLSNRRVHLWMYYYNHAGQLAYYDSATLPANGIGVYRINLPAAGLTWFRGSLRIVSVPDPATPHIAGGRIAAVTNVRNSQSNGDVDATYNTANR